MKGRLRMTATSDSWQVSDGQRERQRERATNLWLCLTGKTPSHIERVYDLFCPRCNMTVHPHVSGKTSMYEQPFSYKSIGEELTNHKVTRTHSFLVDLIIKQEKGPSSA